MEIHNYIFNYNTAFQNTVYVFNSVYDKYYGNNSYTLLREITN